MDSPRRALVSQLVDYVKELRFPWLLAITVGVFLVNVLVPDPIPFADEIVLGLAAAVLASLKRRRGKEPVIDATQAPSRDAN